MASKVWYEWKLKEVENGWLVVTQVLGGGFDTEIKETYFESIEFATVYILALIDDATTYHSTIKPKPTRIEIK